MPRRWDITKAVRASDLPSASKVVMFVLADVAEVGTAEIPQQHTPSLSVLAHETGLDKSTVKRHLATLEAGGWLQRTRPSLLAAVKDKERTRYRLTLPLGAESATLGAQDAQTRRTEPLELGAESAPARRTMRHRSDLTPDQDQIFSDPSELRPDVEKVCGHLADRIAENGSKRPKITEKWRVEARLLIDKDGRTVDQVMKAIDWCQADSFWRANILSMPTLREKYDRLRLSAQGSPNGRASPHASFRNPTDMSVYEEGL